MVSVFLKPSVSGVVTGGIIYAPNLELNVLGTTKKIKLETIASTNIETDSFDADDTSIHNAVAQTGTHAIGNFPKAENTPAPKAKKQITKA
jgi:hypothetical protein